MNKPFQFKQFTVNQDRCAMKIGTDGVLLGAWVSLIHQPKAILDVGTGTGILALMLAQRSSAALIDAVEIDEDAYEQAVENFENSDWGDRLFCYHAELNEFVNEMQDEQQYDLIICNPPFHDAPALASETSSIKEQNTISEQRKLARFNNALPFEELLSGVRHLLSSKGHFNVVIPREKERNFLKISERYNLFPQQITHVKGKSTTPEKRSLIELGNQKKAVEPQVLIIEESRHVYTAEYQDLVSGFYLKM